jgi:hypothetical protein
VLLNQKIGKDFKEAKTNIYDAIKEGRLFIANDHLYPAKGFRFYFVSKDGSDILMGEEDLFREGNLIMELPSNGVIRLIKDGVLIAQWQGREAVYQVKEKGVYRLEVYKPLFLFGQRPWIFSNPIYLR